MHGWRALAVASAVALVCAVGIFVLERVLSITDRNRNAIYVSCVLLSNAIRESGAGGAPDQSSPQRKLNALYVRIIHRAATPAEHREERRLLAQIAKAGPLVTLPDCRDVSRYPDRVQVLP